MNAVTSASSAGAVSAAVVPAGAAGAAAASVRSFDDVLRQLSGGDTPETRAGGVGAPKKGAKAGQGQPIDGDPSPASAGEAPADSSGGAIQMVPVPVPLVPQPEPNAPSPDAPAGTDLADPGEGSRATNSLRPGVVSAPSAAGSRRVATVQADGGTFAFRSTDATAVADGASAAGNAAQGLAPATTAIATSTRAGQAPRSSSLDAGTAGATTAPKPPASTTAIGPVRDSTALASPDGNADSSLDSDSGAGTGPVGDPGRAADVAAMPRSEGRTSPLEGRRRTSAASPEALTAPAAPVLSPTAAESTASPNPADQDRESLLADVAVVAPILNSPAHDPTRALDLSRAGSRLAARRSSNPAAPPAATGDTTAENAATTAAATGTDAATIEALAAVVASTADGAAPVLAATRAPHPSVAAALRAFQQAAVPTAIVATGANTVESDAGRMPALAGRPAGFASIDVAAVALAASSDADRRPLTLPALAVPAFGTEVRIGAAVASTLSAESAALPTWSHADGESVHSQIVQSLRVQWTGSAGEAKVRLRPEYLGEVVATIKVDQGAVTATLQAERPEVRKWLEDNTQTLREALVDHGLKLDRLIVQAEASRDASADDKQGRPRARHQQNPPPRQRRTRGDDTGATFELTT
ncbi:MAG: flagellar hook-length control protein FliK [Acidobacteriota bacterium]